MNDARPSYPPPQHLLRDLRIVLERSDDAVVARLEPTPEVADATGRTRVGVLATLLDVVAGEAAIRSALPDWAATSDLSLSVDEIPTSGPIEARASILRAGRQTIVLEASLRDGRDGREFGLGHLGFARLPAKTDFQSRGHWAEAPTSRTDFGTSDTGFEKPLLEKMGLVRGNGEAAGVAQIPSVPPYLINSLGALQGGALAILLEAAAEHFARVALARPVRVRSLAIHYLKLARVGPIRAESRLLARTAGGVQVHVKLFDGGAGDVLSSVATVQVEEASRVA